MRRRFVEGDAMRRRFSRGIDRLITYIPNDVITSPMSSAIHNCFRNIRP
jgi:hypothetical protein